MLFAGLSWESQDGCLADLRVTGKGQLHLGGFDPETADLHLKVEAPQELNITIRQIASQVAGAVELLALQPQRVGDEAPGGQFRPAKIAACQTVAAEIDLADHTHRRQPSLRIQQADAGIGYWFADRRAGGANPAASQADCRR